MEEERVNPVKKYFFDLWDEQKSLGETPRYDKKMVKRLGFSTKQKDIMGYYREYVGNVYDLRKEFERYLASKEEFTTDDIEDAGFNTGGYDFSFKLRFSSFSINNILFNCPINIKKLPSISNNHHFNL